ncbi:MAG TPA: alpha/beta hydrolase [Acidimicrobiales bacterium]|nr:alpha/beta hydrolase [Acidimicrobiales bacterium]
MRLWDDELEAARAAIRKESTLFVSGFRAEGSATTAATAEERVAALRAGDAAMVLTSDQGRDRVIPGPAGPLRLREFRPEEIRGVLLHFHGGGWVTGSPELTDLLHEALSRSLGLAVVSVDYRLAPEHPYPAAPDDCEAAARWLLESAEAEYGTDRLLVGGESAGAHLAAVTLLRLRHGAAGRFCGANLVFGAYDLSGTPSARGVGTTPGADVLDPDEIAFMLEQFTPGASPEERRRPDLSPLYADLGGMPPALFTVGTADHLFDDTLFMAGRWVAAGNEAELLVYPDGPHACIGVPTVLAHWWPRLEAFLRTCLERAPSPAVP